MTTDTHKEPRPLGEVSKKGFPKMLAFLGRVQAKMTPYKASPFGRGGTRSVTERGKRVAIAIYGSNKR